MSRQTARIVLDSMNLRPALVAHRYASAPDLAEVTSLGMIADLRELARADADKENTSGQDRKNALASIYGPPGTQDKPFAFANGKAIIPIHGMLINRFAYSWGFVTGYNFIRSQVEAAIADPDVDGIVYDVNSYGGTVAGCQETADIIYGNSQRQGGKPSLAIVDSNCYSAAYYLMCGADAISVTPTGGVGSIGVVVMHMDVSKMLDDIGIKVTFITAGAHKVDANPYEPLSAEVTSDIQAEIDKMYEAFVATVVRGRPKLSVQDVKDTEARCYLASDALSLGLIDSIAVTNDAMTAFFSPDTDQTEEPIVRPDPEDDDEDSEDEPDDDEDDNPHYERDELMPGENKPAPVDASAIAASAAAEARTAERARVSGIIGHANAEGREALARHLAMETDMSVEAASAVLAVSPKAVAAPTAPAAGKETNYFAAAMDASKQPNVGTDGPGVEATQTEKPKRSAAILGAYTKMAGSPPKTIDGKVATH